MRPIRRTLLPAVLAGLVLAGCTADEAPDEPSGPTDTPSPTIAPEAETPAAELRAAIGAAIQSHVFLLGVGTDVLLREGSESTAFVETQSTLDENTALLTEIVASVAGEEPAGRFNDLWIAQVGYVNDYARGYAEGNEALRTQMAGELDTFRADLGQLFDELTEGVIPAETATAQIEPMFDGQIAVVDAQAAGGDVTGALRETAGDVPPVADLLAGAIVAQEPETYRDPIDAPAARLRSTTLALWQEHAYLTWYAADAGFRSGFTSSTFGAARASLDANIEAMADLWADDYGKASGRTFGALWSDEVDALLASAQGSTEATADLEAFQEALARLVQRETELLLDRESFEEELEGHVDAITQAISARRAETSQQWDLLFGAGAQVTVAADVVATATIQRFPERYGPDA